MMSRILTCIIIVVILSSACFSQESSCKSSDISISVINANGDVLRGVAAQDFVGIVHKKLVAIKGLVYDVGPRRVLIVADTNKKLPVDSRMAEVEMIQILLNSARPEDTFAIMAAQGAGQDVKFTSDHNAISQALTQPGDGSRGKDPAVLDTIMAGIQWFGKPQPGDAIVVIAANMEGSRKTNAKTVAKALEENHIRMFGLAMGPVQSRSSVAGGIVTSSTSQGLGYVEPGEGGNYGDELFYPLVTNSGGLLWGVMNVNSHINYKISDPRILQDVRRKAQSVSEMVQTYYRMQIDPPQLTRPENWDLSIKDEIQKHSAPIVVLYPHELGPC
jgi:hypothetical protein